MRFEYVFLDDLPPISADRLAELAWELDIADWEMNRTHWAIKDVNLYEVLIDAGIIQRGDAKTYSADEYSSQGPAATQLMVTPTVFAIPTAPREPRLVALMMPFAREFDEVADAIRGACEDADLQCERVDDVWDETTVIQEVFNLLFRSAVVVVDVTGRNSNVMYETGIAHTLGRSVVPIAQAVDHLPFDLAHHRALRYLPNTEGLLAMRSKLASRLRHLTA